MPDLDPALRLRRAVAAVDRARRTGRGAVASALIDELAGAVHAVLSAGQRPRTETRQHTSAKDSLAGCVPSRSTAWAAIAESVDRRLTVGPDWLRLSAALWRAAVAGYDVTTQLPRLATQAPLPARHPAREMQYRLLADCPAALPATTAVDIAAALNPPATEQNGDAR